MKKRGQNISFVAKVALVISVILCSVPASLAQETYSPNTFSPYTMFGLGDCVSPATASQRAMGGVGVAMRPNSHVGPSGVHMEVNYMNPAALGFVPQKSALFSIGGIWYSYIGKGWGYDYNGNLGPATGSRNSFTLNDIGLSIPLSRSLGLGFSLTPTTVVGYRITQIGSDPELAADIGRAVYTYSGEGGVNEFKTSLGGRLFKNFSIGVSLGYYFGNIDKYYQANVLQELISTQTYRYIDGIDHSHISELFMDCGFIYTFRLSKDGYLNIGGTFRTASFMDVEKTKTIYVTNGGAAVDSLATGTAIEHISIPRKFSGGLFYNNTKLSVGVDFDYQDYADAFNTNEEITGYSLSNQYQVRAGVSYTPDRFDYYETFKRLTYKFGLKYGNTYLVKDGYHMRAGSVTLGVDIPLKRGSLSKLAVSFEGGVRGQHVEGQIQEIFLKLNLGFNFFGEDMWFQRRKFY